MPETIKFVRGNLPHWIVAERPYFVTIRVFGSLPTSVVRELLRERERLAKDMDLREDAWTDLMRKQFMRIERILDACRQPNAWLRMPDVAEVVFGNLKWLEEQRGWRIYAATLMPTHLHMVIRNMEGRTSDLLEDLSQYKGFSGRVANRILGRKGRFWAREDFDHWCRNQAKTEGAVHYTISNPVKAGLAGTWQEWPWTRLDSSVLRRPAEIAPALFSAQAEDKYSAGYDRAAAGDEDAERRGNEDRAVVAGAVLSGEPEQRSGSPAPVQRGLPPPSEHYGGRDDRTAADGGDGAKTKRRPRRRRVSRVPRQRGHAIAGAVQGRERMDMAAVSQSAFRNPHSEISRGSVLILALWTLFFLGALALAVGSHVSANVELAAGIRDRTRAYLLSRGAVERTMVVIASVKAATNIWDGLSPDSWSNDETQFRNVPCGEAAFSVWYTSAIGKGILVTNYGVIGEESRINVNQADRKVLAAFFHFIGGAEEWTADVMASNLVTRRRQNVSGDSSPKSHKRSLTAEENKGYDRPQSQGFRSVREVRLIQGMTEEMFAKLEPYVTVYGESGKVNLNAAPGEIIRCVAAANGIGDGRKFAERILELRPRRDLGEFRKLVLAEDSDLFPGKLQSYFTVESTCFRGVAEGGAEGRVSTRSRIEFVVSQDGRKLYWHE